MMEIKGTYYGSGKCFGIVASRFNELISQQLVDGAVDCLARHGVNKDDITIVWVPGAFEIPIVAARVAEKLKTSAIICVGAVIQGSTDHHEYVATNAIAGISREAARINIPITLRIITASTIEQAIERAGTKHGNLGWNAALSALDMASVLSLIDEASN